MGQSYGGGLFFQSIKAYANMLFESEQFWAFMLIFASTLVMLNAIPFYPLPLSVALAFVAGFVASRLPWAGTLIATALVIPAAGFQGGLLGWVFLLMLAIVLVMMFKHWNLISLLQITILAPFSLSLPFLGFLSMLGMVAATLQFGSRKALFIAGASVFAILFLSAMWSTQNTAYLPLHFSQYPASELFSISRPASSLAGFSGAFTVALSNLTNFDTLGGLTGLLEILATKIIKLFLGDSTAMQIVLWTVCLYVVGLTSGFVKGRFSQSISVLFISFVVAGYYGLSFLFSYSFSFGMVLHAAFVIACFFTLDVLEIKVSREVQVEKGEKLKKYSKFGLQDVSEGSSEKSLADVGGYDDIKEELRRAIITPLERKELAYTYGIKPPRGILLFGPPGTGKTMLMRALSKELKYGFYYIKSSSILSSWFGESEKNITEIFSIARKNSPAILFFDEIDSIGKKRGGDETANRVLSALLAEMDGINQGKPVMIVGATNIPDQLDPALMRPGRFDKIVYMRLPNQAERKDILKLQTKKLPMEKGIDFEELARKTERFSGADLKNVVQESLSLTARDAQKSNKVMPLTGARLFDIVKRIRPSTSIADLERFETFKKDFERRVGDVKDEQKVEEVITWDDVVGLDKVKQSLLDSIEFPLLHEKEMRELKIKPSKGILLFGPPGTGKTLIVRAASNELKATFLSLNAAEVVKEGYSHAAQVIKETFNRAREQTPTLLFIDELETLVKSRTGLGAELVGQLLTELDGIKELKGVVVIAATNKPSMIDPALLRPGRFDKIFYIPSPDENARKKLFELYLGEFAKSVDAASLASQTRGFSGADISSVCQAVKLKILKEKIHGDSLSISTDAVMEILKKRRPSITVDLLEEYKAFLMKYGERQ